MLVRAGGGAFEKLSIPRDTFAAIPGQENQKINGAYAFGGARLQVETIEDFLGIDVNHVVILDFEGFADFIDSLGGVQVALRDPVKSLISGGASNGGVNAEAQTWRERARRPAGTGARGRTREKPEGSERWRSRARVAPAAHPRRDPGPPDQPDPGSLQLPATPPDAWNAPKAMVSDMAG